MLLGYEKLDMHISIKYPRQSFEVHATTICKTIIYRIVIKVEI